MVVCMCVLLCSNSHKIFSRYVVALSYVMFSEL